MASSENLIQTLTDLLEETKLSTGKGTKVVEKLEEAQKIVKDLKAEETHTGVLSKFRLHGQVALVTGGGQGIGRGFAHALGEAGAKVAVADIVQSRAETVTQELNAKGVDSIAVHVDVSKKEACEAMVKKVLETWGDLHIAFNNAGIMLDSDSEEAPKEEWDQTTAVNLDGVFFCCQAEAKHMLGKNYGRIINTASVSGRIVSRWQNHTAYYASKAGVIHLTKTIGVEWASRGVTVNCISPGLIETAINDNQATAAETQELFQKIISNTPIRRAGRVEDLAGLAVFLASPLSDFMTGSDLIVDGGFTCW